jgi:hypothetical protein
MKNHRHDGSIYGYGKDYFSVIVHNYACLICGHNYKLYASGIQLHLPGIAPEIGGFV